MDEQTVRRIFIAFLALLLGAVIGGGLVMFCARSPASAATTTITASH